MTEFLCPEKGCAALFGDWGSLQDHLRDEHQIEASLTQYNAARRQAGLEPLGTGEQTLTRTNTQEQQTNRGTNKQSGSTIVQNGVPSVVPGVFACPYCDAVETGSGKPFTDPETVWRHYCGSSKDTHPAGVSHDEFFKMIGAPIKGGVSREKEEKERPTYRHEEADEEEGYFEPMKVEGEPFVRMPDVYKTLWQHSRRFGLSAKGADTFIAAMQNRDPDDLSEMRGVLTDMSAGNKTIKLLVDNWARSRGLGVYGRGYNEYGRSTYDRFDRREPEPDDISHEIDKQFDELRKLSLIRAMQGPGEEESESVKALAAQVRQLSEKLDLEKEARTRDQIQRLEKQVEELKTSEGDIQTQVVKQVGGAVQEMASAFKLIAYGAARASGFTMTEGELPSTFGIKRSSRGGIASLIPAEFLEVE